MFQMRKKKVVRKVRRVSPSFRPSINIRFLCVRCICVRSDVLAISWIRSCHVLQQQASSLSFRFCWLRRHATHFNLSYTLQSRRKCCIHSAKSITCLWPEHCAVCFSARAKQQIVRLRHIAYKTCVSVSFWPTAHRGAAAFTWLCKTVCSRLSNRCDVRKRNDSSAKSKEKTFI